MTKEMTEGSPLRLIFNFSLPLILGSLLQQTYSLIDAAIVGKYLGINDLAAVGASTSVVFLIIGFCTGCCCGFGIPVAQAFGARSYSDLRRYVANSLWVSLIISVVLAVVTSLLCERILFMMQTPHDILHHAYLYLLVTFIGIPFTFLYNLLSSLIRALGDSKTPFYFLLMAAILNIVLDLFCILILHWGVAGAAIATVFSQAVSALLCLYYMFRKFDILKMEKGETALDKHYIKGLLDMGVPMDCNFLHRHRKHHAPKRKQRLGYVVRGRPALPPACASKCSSCVRWKAWVSPWPHIADKTTGREKRNVSTWGCAPAFSWFASTASFVSSCYIFSPVTSSTCLWISMNMKS